MLVMKKCKNVTLLWTLIFYKYPNVGEGADEFFLDLCFICSLGTVYPVFSPYNFSP